MADIGSLESFSDFMQATRQLPMSTPDTIMNQSSRHRTYLTRLMMGGLSAEEYFQGGTEIIEQIQLKYTGNARNYSPTDTQAPSGSNSLTPIKFPWRFKLVDSVWTDQEIILNGESDTRSMFKRLATVKRQKMFTDFFDAINDDVWAAPDSTQMEGGTSTGSMPYSLRAFITTAGGAPTATAVGSGGDGAVQAWTTVATVNPSTYTNWANAVATYDATSSTTIGTSLEGALEDLTLQLNWEAPEDGSGNTGIDDPGYDKRVILTNKEGYKYALQVAKNYWKAIDKKGASLMGLARNGVTFNGIPIKYISAMDAAGVCASGKPRFYCCDFTFIKLVFHKNRYLYAKSFEGTPAQPMANVEYRDTWWNLVCTNRRAQGIVVPVSNP